MYFHNPFMPSGLFYVNTLNRSISYIRDVWLVISSSEAFAAGQLMPWLVVRRLSVHRPFVHR